MKSGFRGMGRGGIQGEDSAQEFASCKGMSGPQVLGEAE